MGSLSDRSLFRAPSRGVAALLVLLPALCSPAASRAEDGAPPAVRQIAPGFMPYYNLGSPAGAGPAGSPPFEVVLPSRERPLGGCDRSLSRILFNRCLYATLEFSRRMLEMTVAAARTSVEARSDLPPGYRSRWIRVLDEVHARWKEARNLECGQLVFLERGPKANIFEERAQCTLAAERERIEDLRRRYGLE
ncbi:DUF1311 domain-containing protein [Blastochloris sulfoviridis]|uniref:DUF1311 domain-containing protein n=1 Tax=Blastochloris sulfoviridis TaxID=50712 RepID=A0A5M6I5Q9_9HYPH|nr:DUF1311 domain-containing protein [Blastochloris sulfoviridis]KAA5603165.1 hypothetical protein F1193_02775 [Blastochloris sulfoviridis]